MRQITPGAWVAAAAVDWRGRLIILIAYSGLVAIAGLTQLPPIDRDETRFAQATAQMIESRDPVAIRFLDEERNKKPAGIHWLQALSVATVSSAEARDIWAYRLPSVLAIIFAATMTARIGEHLFGPGPGLLAGVLLASAPIVWVEASLAKTDAALLAVTTAAFAAFVEILHRTADGKRVPAALPVCFWISVSFGILIKGPVILMVVAPAIAICAWRLRFVDVMPSLKPLTGLGIMLTTVLPWVVAVSIATEGRFITEAVGRDMLAKVGSAQERHAGPPGYHLLLLWPLFWPAMPLIADGAVRAVSERMKWRWLLICAWVAPAWTVFELTATKLPHYTLPLYPAIAIAAAAATLEKKPTPVATWRRRWGAVAYFMVGLTFAVALGLTPFAGAISEVFNPNAPPITSSLRPLTSAGLALLLVAGCGGVALDYYRGATWKPAVCASALSAALAWAALALALPSLSPFNLSTRIAKAVEAAERHELKSGAPGAILIGYTEPSVIFLLGSGTVIEAPSAGAQTAAQRKGGVAIVESRGADEFRARASEIGVSLSHIAEFDELNYSNGRSVRITIYAID